MQRNSFYPGNWAWRWLYCLLFGFFLLPIKTAHAIIDVSGTWRSNLTEDARDCDEGTFNYELDFSITQTGATVTVKRADIAGTGTLVGRGLTIDASYPEDGGTVNESFHIEFSADGATADVSSNWTWSGYGYSCSGTTTGSAIKVAANVTPLAGPNGSIYPPTPQSVSYGSSTSFTVTPDASYRIDAVTGCGGSLSGNTYTTGSITGNCSVTATFAANTVDPDIDELVLKLEDPIQGSSGASISNIRGWAVARSGIARVELHIDGAYRVNIPMGGKRGDVANAYPDYPNSLESGFSMAYNYGLLEPGQHTFMVRAIDNTGNQAERQATISTQRYHASFFPSPDAVDLSEATFFTDGSSIDISNLRVDGLAYDTTLNWRTAVQGFVITDITSHSASALTSRAATSAPTGMVPSNIDVPEITLKLEEPAFGLTAASISNIRGWAVSSNGMNRIEYSVDGVFKGKIPLGGSRRDVGGAYPNYPGSSESGFGMAYNYGLLESGAHELKIKAVDNSGLVEEISIPIVTERFQSSFISNPDAMDLSAATVSGSGQTLVIHNAYVEGQEFNVTLEWRTAYQGFAITRIVMQ